MQNKEIVEKTSNFSRKASHAVFSEPFWGALEPLDRFWTTFWSLWGTLVTKSLPKVARRLPKGAKSDPKGNFFWNCVYYVAFQKM